MRNKRKKHVAILGTRGYPSFYGGFETAVREIASYLADNNWVVSVYGRKGNVHAEWSGRDARVQSIVTPGINTKSLSTLTYGFTSTIASIFRGSSVALIMNVANGFWIPILRLFGIRSVVNVDGIEWERAKWGKLAKATFRFGARLTALFADEIVADSIAIQRRWKSEFNRESVFIPYGASFTAPLPAPLGLETGNFILMVARFVPENSIYEFFEAVEHLDRKLAVVIVGSSGFGGELDDLAKHLSLANKNVRWLGHLNDELLLHALWQHCGAYFHGHTVGGTNPALVQAMANGAPVVAINTVYNLEVLGDQSQVCDREPRAIAKRLSELVENGSEQARLGQRNKLRASQHYTWDQVCFNYNALLEATISDGGK